jgi:hypothetical protein
MSDEKTDRDLDAQVKKALAAFDARAAANEELARAMVLVEFDPRECVWAVRLWHGVTHEPTESRVGVRTLWEFDGTDEGEEAAQQMARLLVWWMRVSLNLNGKKTTEKPCRSAV